MQLNTSLTETTARIFTVSAQLHILSCLLLFPLFLGIHNLVTSFRTEFTAYQTASMPLYYYIFAKNISKQYFFAKQSASY